MTTFKDLFSAGAKDYSRYRPGYPPGLFEYLASLPPERRLVWDAGTGSGQAAVGLASHFEKVVATDPSEKQLEAAKAHPRVEYRQGGADSVSLPADSADLVTVAQAFHWFPRDKFYEEVRRVTRPGGVLAVWCYAICHVDEAVDGAVARYYEHIVGPYWEFERKLVEDGYRSIPFPFDEMTSPPFSISLRWSLADMVGYLGTWSATQGATKALGKNPLEDFTPELARAWRKPTAEKTVRWDLHLRVGRVKKLHG